MNDVGDRTNVVLVCTRRAVRFDLHAAAVDLARERLNMRDRSWARARKAEIEGVDSQRLDQVEDLDFLFYGWIANGWRLQAVAQGFVIQQHVAGRKEGVGINPVPVVDK